MGTTAFNDQASDGMARRLFIYVKESPKLWGFILVALLVGYAAHQAMAVMYALEPTPPLSFDYIIGIATYALIMWHWRFSDEIKDYETDKRVFPDRPVPSGRVKPSDLKVGAHGIAVVLFTLNLFLWNVAFGYFLFILAYTLLMSKWFFLENLIGNNRLLAFVTHAPAAVLVTYYFVIIFCTENDLPIYTWDAVVLALWFCCPLFAQEFARKTYAPSMEIEGYQTYSSMIGYRASAFIALFFTSISMGLSIYLYINFPFHTLLLFACSILFVGTFLVTLAFMLRPSQLFNSYLTVVSLYIPLIYLTLIVSSLA